MDLAIIVRDGLASSFVSSLGMALEARRAGRAVAVVFTQEALAALAERSFRLPPLLEPRREAIARRAGARGMSVDPLRLVEEAGAAGVQLLACPIWADLLELEGAGIPRGVRVAALQEVVRVVEEARRVIGTL